MAEVAIAAAEISDAVGVLRRGGLVAFPTETVYGLGCDAEHAPALARLYAVKRRPADHPVIVHLADARALDDWSASASPAARALAAAFWPGPLTLVVPRASRVPDAATGGRDTVALRVPDQSVACRLLRAFGGGIAAPSANRHGRVSPTTADHVRADLDGDVDLILDGGPCAVGVESTIVDCSRPQPAILRLGGVTRAEVEAVIGTPVALLTAGEVPAPGTRPAHYAPDARVLIVDRGGAAAAATSRLAAGERVALLVLDPPAGLPAGLVVLDPPADVDDYARVLYARLREADRRGVDVVLAVPPPEQGLGAAVADRLARAAAPSPDREP